MKKRCHHSLSKTLDGAHTFYTQCFHELDIKQDLIYIFLCYTSHVSSSSLFTDSYNIVLQFIAT